MEVNIAVLAVIIAGSAGVAAAAAGAALRDHRAAAERLAGRAHSWQGLPGPGPGLADRTVAGLAAAITAVAVASGITAALWVTGQGHAALEALDLAGATVITAGAGYAAGRRRSRPAAAARPAVPPARPGMPAGPGSVPAAPPVWARRAGQDAQDTVEFGPEVAQWLREAATGPPPRPPRPRRGWRPFGPGDGPGQEPN